MRLTDANKVDEILKVESKYSHLNTFSDDPDKDAYVLYAFGSAIFDSGSKDDEIRLDHVIDYFERAKERVEDSNACDRRDRREAQKSFKVGIETYLVGLYSDGRDMEKAIYSHRWLLENCSRHEVKAIYVIISAAISFDSKSLSTRLKYWRDPWT